jgi:hypothetical protein
VACLVVTAAAFYIYSPYLSLTAAPSGPRASAGAWSNPPSETRTALPAPSSTPASSPTTQAPEGDLPPGPGGQQPGIRLVATVLATGVFEVTETVRLAAPVSSLTLAPPDLRAASGNLRAARPRANELVVRVDGRRVNLPRRTVRRPTTIALRRPTDRFEISYELHGSVRISRPSSAGRALGAVAPLISRQPGDLPVAVTVRGEAVRNLGCVRLPVDEQACLTGQRPNVRVNRDLPLRAALVQVQLDLRAAKQGRR